MNGVHVVLMHIGLSEPCQRAHMAGGRQMSITGVPLRARIEWGIH